MKTGTKSIQHRQKVDEEGKEIKKKWRAGQDRGRERRREMMGERDKERKDGRVEVKRQTASHLRNGLINTIDRTERGGERWSCSGALRVN